MTVPPTPLPSLNWEAKGGLDGAALQAKEPQAGKPATDQSPQAPVGKAGGTKGGTGGADAPQADPGGPPTYRATTPPASWGRKDKRKIRYYIIMGMSPKKSYKPGERVMLGIDLYFVDDPTKTVADSKDGPHTIYDVPMIYQGRHKLKGDTQTEFDLYFEKDFYVTELKAGVLGGPSAREWYRWAEDD